MRHLFTILFLSLATTASAQTHFEPQRGTDLRQDLMDTMRPIAEYYYGAPVEFVVSILRASEDVAFLQVNAQRPGGEPINRFTTPAFVRDDLDLSVGDLTVEALLVKSGRMWVPLHLGINSTEGWWHASEYCPQFWTVLPRSCQ